MEEMNTESEDDYVVSEEDSARLEQVIAELENVFYPPRTRLRVQYTDDFGHKNMIDLVRIFYVMPPKKANKLPVNKILLACALYDDEIDYLLRQSYEVVYYVYSVLFRISHDELRAIDRRAINVANQLKNNLP